MIQTNIIRKGNAHTCIMNHELVSDSVVTYITFENLEKTGIVKQAFSTRMGGVSNHEFSTMNFSMTRGDDKDKVEENYRRISKILGCEPKDMVCTDQTHTTNVRKVTAADKGKGVVRPRDYTDTDGLITNEQGIVLATFYADCVPLYVVDPVHHAIGLSHSGWRGTIAKMGKVTLDAMKSEYGTNPADVQVAIGPSICQDCYEVSEDVAQAFQVNFIDDVQKAEDFLRHFEQEPGENRIRDCLVYKKANGKYQLNLWYANYRVFRDAGVPDTQITVTDICTCCNPQLLFSHRASQGKRGNLGAFLMLR